MLLETLKTFCSDLTPTQKLIGVILAQTGRERGKMQNDESTLKEKRRER